jgi:hypothetical protein
MLARIISIVALLGVSAACATSATLTAENVTVPVRAGPVARIGEAPSVVSSGGENIEAEVKFRYHYTGNQGWTQETIPAAVVDKSVLEKMSSGRERVVLERIRITSYFFYLLEYVDYHGIEFSGRVQAAE